jgi:hypothetical protein
MAICISVKPASPRLRATCPFVNLFFRKAISTLLKSFSTADAQKQIEQHTHAVLRQGRRHCLFFRKSERLRALRPDCLGGNVTLRDMLRSRLHSARRAGDGLWKSDAAIPGTRVRHFQ